MQALLQNVKQSNWWRTIKLAGARWVQEDGDQRAAAFAYYLLLSLLPLTLLVAAAGSLFVEREVATQAVVKLVNRYTPLTGEQERGAVATIRDWLNARGKISLVVIPMLLWGALKFLRTLIRTTNRVWHSQTYNWWRLPLKSLGLLGITASAVLIGILLPAVAGLTGRWLATHLEFPKWAFGLMFHLIPCLVLFYGLIMIYRLAPSRALAWPTAVPGLRGEPRPFQCSLRRPGRHRGVPAVALPFELRRRTRHLLLRGAGGGWGESKRGQFARLSGFQLKTAECRGVGL